VKPEFEKSRTILIKKDKHIRRYNYTTEQNLKPIEDHVWFEDRWMVASWCDE
jgi:hypothetical protein